MSGRFGGHLSSRRGGDTADLREHNLALVLGHLRDHGPASRASIADSTGLGLSTLTGMIAELRALGLVSDALAETQSGLGRPTHEVALAGERWVVAGIHLGVTGLQAKTATVGGHPLGQYVDRAELHEARVGVLALLLSGALEWIVDSTAGPAELVAIEVSVSGSLVAARDWADDFTTGLLSGARRRLAALGRPEVFLGLGEESTVSAVGVLRAQLRGRAPGTVVLLGGDRRVGGSILVDGEPQAAGASAPDFGRLPVPDSAGPDGCLESVAGLTALLVSAGVAGPMAAEGLVRSVPRDAVLLLRAALDRRDALALAAVARAAAALGVAVESLVVTLRPRLLVLDGYLGALGDHLVPAIEDRLRARHPDGSGGAVQILALEPSGSRGVDGAVSVARDSCLARPTRIRG